MYKGCIASCQGIKLTYTSNQYVFAGKKGVLSFLRGSVSSREKSPNRTASTAGAGVSLGKGGRLSKFDVDTVRYTPRLDQDSIEETGISYTVFRVFCILVKIVQPTVHACLIFVEHLKTAI